MGAFAFSRRLATPRNGKMFPLLVSSFLLFQLITGSEAQVDFVSKLVAPLKH